MSSTFLHNDERGDRDERRDRNEERGEKPDVPVNRNTQRKCRFYNSKAGCKKGKDCLYLHIGSDDNRADEESRQNGRNEGKKAEEGKKHTEEEKCRYFNTKKGCFRGVKCPFPHELDEPINQGKLAKNGLQGMHSQVHSRSMNKSQIMETMVKLNQQMMEIMAERND